MPQQRNRRGTQNLSRAAPPHNPRNQVLQRRATDRTTIQAGPHVGSSPERPQTGPKSHRDTALELLQARPIGEKDGVFREDSEGNEDGDEDGEGNDFWEGGLVGWWDLWDWVAGKWGGSGGRIGVGCCKGGVLGFQGFFSFFYFFYFISIG